MTTWRTLPLALLAGAAMFAAPLHASDGNPGRQAYFRYCSSCHGADGRGGGEVATSLRKKPADLTQLAKRHDGTFPQAEVKDIIDGRKHLAAHGSRIMPVWGRVFGEEKSYEPPEAHTRSQEQLIVDYLATIQTN